MAMTLKAARINRGLNQTDASKQLGISQKTLSNYESGKTKPKEPIIRQMVKIYGIPFEHLIF